MPFRHQTMQKRDEEDDIGLRSSHWINWAITPGNNSGQWVRAITLGNISGRTCSVRTCRPPSSAPLLTFCACICFGCIFDLILLKTTKRKRMTLKKRLPGKIWVAATSLKDGNVWGGARCAPPLLSPESSWVWLLWLGLFVPGGCGMWPWCGRCSGKFSVCSRCVSAGPPRSRREGRCRDLRDPGGSQTWRSRSRGGGWGAQLMRGAGSTEASWGGRST